VPWRAVPSEVLQGVPHSAAGLPRAKFCAEMQCNLIGWPELIERYLDLIGISAARRR
jgi:hypothetical protein